MFRRGHFPAAGTSRHHESISLKGTSPRMSQRPSTAASGAVARPYTHQNGHYGGCLSGVRPLQSAQVNVLQNTAVEVAGFDRRSYKCGLVTIREDPRPHLAAKARCLIQPSAGARPPEHRLPLRNSTCTDQPPTACAQLRKVVQEEGVSYRGTTRTDPRGCKAMNLYSGAKKGFSCAIALPRARDPS